MNSTPQSSTSAPINGRPVLTRDTQGRLWFNRLLGFGRPEAKVGANPRTPTDWRSSPPANYRTDGTYDHEKPTAGPSQFGVAGRLPAVAFGMPEAEFDDLARAARVTALCGQPLSVVQQDARARFEGRWAQCRAQFTARVATGRRVVERLNSRIAVLQREVDALPVLVVDQTKTLSFPRDARLIPLLLFALLWCGVVVADWWLLASKQFDLSGDVWKSLLSTASWLAAPLLLKFALFSRAGRVAEWLLAGFKHVSVVLLLAFVGLYARYGVGSATSAESIAAQFATAIGNESAPAVGATDLGWIVFALQIGLCLCTSAALTFGIRELMVGRAVAVLNPDRQALEAEVGRLIDDANQEEARMAPHSGLIDEYDRSLARYLAHGERAWHATQAEHDLLQQQDTILERQRALLEQKRRLLGA